MARGFNATFGAGTSDKITSGYTTAASSTYSVTAWLWVNGKGGGNFGNTVNQQTSSGGGTNFIVFMNNSTTVIGFSQAFSTTNGGWTFNGTGTGKWQHIAITYNSTSTGNNPVIYVNGSSVSVTVTQAPVGAATVSSQNFRIGNNGNSGSVFDGKIAEVGYWNGSILTANEIAALAKGVSPFFIRPSGLSLYFPLYGTASGEPDWGPNHATQTIVGTKAQNHAPVGLWLPPATVSPGFRFNGALALAQGASATALAMSEKFHAAAVCTQPNASLALAGGEKFHASGIAVQSGAASAIAGFEKFSGALAPAANMNTAVITGMEMEPSHPGRAVIGDAAQGGLSALADAALYRVYITESV